ncbi:porin, partial [Acinetobacter schindleri]
SSDTTEQRINLLETELQKLKAELAAQKQTQNNLQVKQVKIEENIEKTKATVTEKPVAPSWVTSTDNVKVYGIARIDAAVDFKSSPASGGRTT